MNGTAIVPNIYDFPIDGPHTDDDYEEPKRGWVTRRLEDAGIKEMAPTSTRPPGYNWTVIGGICAVISTVLVLMGLFCAGAYYMGIQAQQMEMLKQDNMRLQKDVEKAQNDAAEAKKFSIYATAGADEKNGHKPNQEKK
jgi:hypothetical protein